MLFRSEMNKILLLISLMILPAVNSIEITSYEARVEIVNMTPKESIALALLNTDDIPVQEINYPFSGQVEEIKVSDSRGEIPSNLEYKGNNAFVTARLREPLPKGDSVSLGYNIKTHGLLTKVEDTFILSQTHSILANVKNFRLSIALPDGYGVMAEGVSPRPTIITSDGRKIILVWEYASPIPTQLRELKILLLFDKLTKEEPVVVVKQKVVPVETPPSTNWLPYIIIAALVFMLIPLAVHYLREEGITIADYIDRRKYAEEKIDILKEDEQAILKLVIEKDGIDQREIQKITDFSKTKVSKILSELEKRGVIVKQQTGRRNKIFLASKMKESV